MEELRFLDLKTKQTFQSDNYKIQEKNGRRFAVATSPSGGQSYRAVAKK